MRLGRLRIPTLATIVILAMTMVAASAPGGSIVSNAASASYSDGARSYQVQSNTIETTIAQISALVVSPKNKAVNPATDGVAGNGTFTRTFTITNDSNITDAYTIIAATTSLGSIVSIAFIGPNGPIPVTLNGTISPQVAAGESITVVVTISDIGLPLGTAIAVGLTARTTVTGSQNGLATDNGFQWGYTMIGPSIAGISGPKTQVSKVVDSVQSETRMPGATVTYEIDFQNYGQLPATTMSLVDTVPFGVHADATSVHLNGSPVAATVAGSTLTVPVGTLPPGLPMHVTFIAKVDATLTIGSTYVNIATLTADGMSAIATTPASIFVGQSNIVFDGYSAAGAPVGAAVVTLVDSATGAPLVLATAGRGAQSERTLRTINPKNANPFVTGPDGAYGFLLPAPAIGTTASFDITIAAQSFIPRRIHALLTPDATGVLYSVSLTANDGQPLALAGGFTLTSQRSVTLANVFSLLGNLPMFSNKPIAVTKVADKTQASPGDRLVYTVTVAANAQTGLGATTVVDTLPAGVTYAAGTGRVDGAAVEPERHGSRLTWRFAQLATNTTHTLVYACVVLPNVAAQTTMTNAVDVNGIILGTTVNASGTASVSVVATSGIFTERSVITGRVFVDVAGSGHFREGDVPLAGVRLFLENGESVTTDREGRYSFPGARAGMHVMRLDESTLPGGARAFHDRRIDSVRSPVRLIHGIMDSGLLQDINFALEAAS